MEREKVNGEKGKKQNEELYEIGYLAQKGKELEKNGHFWGHGSLLCLQIRSLIEKDLIISQ